MFRGTSWLVPALLATACTLRAPPGPWPDEWSTWEESKAVTTTAQSGELYPELDVPEFEDPWAGLPIGPVVPEVAAAEEPAPPEAQGVAAADGATGAPTEVAATEVAPPGAAEPEVPASPPAGEGSAAPAPVPEAVADGAKPDGNPPEIGSAPPTDPPAGATADPAASETGAPPASDAEVAAAEPAPPPAPPLSDVDLLDAQVFTVVDAPLGALQNVIVDPRTGDVLGAILLPPEPDAKPRFLAMRDLVRREAGGGLVSPAAPAVDVAELFAAEDIVPIRGEVTSVQREPNGPEGSALLKVRDAENLLHRIRFAAPDLVLPHLPVLGPGVAIEAQGAATRDDEGKVWIAASLSSGEQVVRLRDAAGTLLWEELSANMLPARTLLGRQVVHAGATYTLAGWTLAPDLSRIAEVALRSESATITVPWGELSLTGEQR